MAFLEWSDKFVTGIALIDTQHRWLVDLTNRLYDEMNAHEPQRDEIGKVLEGLMEYTVNHFITEESLFATHHYPDAAEHASQHNHFTAQIMSLLQRHESGETVSSDILSFLKDWLIAHILHADRAYLPFLADVK
jgi:hemerythrin